MTSPDDYLVVGSVLFVLGAIGFLTRRNLILMMLSTELMLHGVSLSLVAFSSAHRNYEGQAFTISILTVATCEAGLALALILVLYRRRKSLDVNLWSDLGESPLRPPVEDAAAVAPAEPPLPRLAPAGRVPSLNGDRDSEPRLRRKETAGRV